MTKKISTSYGNRQKNRIETGNVKCFSLPSFIRSTFPPRASYPCAIDGCYKYMTQKVRNNNKQKLVESRGEGGAKYLKNGEREREKDGTWSIPRRVCKGRRRRISRRNTKSVIQFLNKTKQNPPKKFRIKCQNKINFKKLINNKKRVEKFRKVS